MLYGVISDIHGNFQALSSVLSFLKEKGISNYIILGDIIGYGPQPVECINAIKELGESARIVLGNHDAVLVGKMDIKWFNEYAKKSIEITMERLNDEMRLWFSNIPEKIEFNNILLVHGSPKSPLKEYLLSAFQYENNVKNLNADVVFLGHTHMPAYFYKDLEGKVIGDMIKPFQRIKIKKEYKFFINPGSVGQPRDGNPMASCGIFDDVAMTFELFRVKYDVKKTQEMMNKLNMPSLLIERLGMGY